MQRPEGLWRLLLGNGLGDLVQLCLGRSQRYKNARLLVQLAPLLDILGLDLWMAGDVDAAAIGEARPANLRLLGRIGDDDLKRALAGALAFLFPSRIEGFGLPALEALASGTPVAVKRAARAAKSPHSAKPHTPCPCVESSMAGTGGVSPPGPDRSGRFGEAAATGRLPN